MLFQSIVGFASCGLVGKNHRYSANLQVAAPDWTFPIHGLDWAATDDKLSAPALQEHLTQPVRSSSRSGRVSYADPACAITLCVA